MAIDTGEVATAQAGVRETSVTLIPGAGAAAGVPLLVKLMVIGVPKLALGFTDDCTMSREAVVVAAVIPSR